MPLRVVGGCVVVDRGKGGAKKNNQPLRDFVELIEMEGD